MIWEGLVVQHYGRSQFEVQVFTTQIHIPSNRQYKQVNLNRFGNRLNWAFGAVTHANLEPLIQRSAKIGVDPKYRAGIINASHRPTTVQTVIIAKPVAANISLIVIVFAPICLSLHRSDWPLFGCFSADATFQHFWCWNKPICSKTMTWF